MNQITTKEVSNLAILARVGLTSEEEVALASQMTDILEFASELEKVNTDGVLPTSQVSGLTSVFRDDRAVDSLLTRDELLSNTPEVEEKSIKVKKVL